MKKSVSLAMLIMLVTAPDLYAQAYSATNNYGVSSNGYIDPAGAMNSTNMYGTSSTGFVAPSGAYTSTDMYGNTTTGFIPGYAR